MEGLYKGKHFNNLIDANDYICGELRYSGQFQRSRRMFTKYGEHTRTEMRACLPHTHTIGAYYSLEKQTVAVIFEFLKNMVVQGEENLFFHNISIKYASMTPFFFCFS